MQGGGEGGEEVCKVPEKVKETSAALLR